MKKYYLLLLTLLISLCFVGCSNNSSQSEPASEETSTVKSTTEVKKDFSDLTDKGKGTFYLSTSGGTSENGNVPIIYLKKDTSLIQIGCNSTDFDGTKISFVYIDGILSSKEQLAETQVSINITKTQLSVGTHTVDVVQYDNNQETGNIITHKSASYEIQSLS